MIRIDYDEALLQADEILDRAEKGESFEIVRDGRAHARVIPVEKPKSPPSPAAIR
jgi:prevent-host-death family protein